ncbi:hypothetical protein AJ85_08860 [Alkalihalobacillus alcalophilus ATCC 27647 = CGMCC 1.3604]|uniref:DUF3986 domain-containing protein n=1 Tax=Alkalihalobacillus alcalophilus ATCC 27647 = CGMCC 1.3604 TaxID=1218173 RepID=A0A4S4JZS2_ALKAL|nr:DUF3986 family protein [Alkalihalobacillus alcalophilus]MED1563501.1 DUF3986 family protein [Alkalihalobacillus alcalophilus]THG90781.1 hypothetical protein AJ85_08860 [Alkalihalobacillus alcalophilus ATCC 27647 = CGMCC 1.3604]
MLKFVDEMHMHAGFYEKGFDLEGIFLKVHKKDIWCLFFNFHDFNIKISNESKYPKVEQFGCLVEIVQITEAEFTDEIANNIFIDFLKSESII